MKKILSFSLPVIILLSGCKISQKEELTTIQKKVNEFVEVELTSDLIAELSEKERQMLPYLFDAADIMDKLFWKQAYGDKSELLDTITDEATRAFVLINYGPWERLNNNRPFIEGAGEKPAGASFYPPDMTREEFEALDAPDKTSLYTLIRRDENGNLITVPYHEAYRPELEKAAELIRKAAGLAEDED